MTVSESRPNHPPDRFEADSEPLRGAEKKSDPLNGELPFDKVISSMDLCCCSPNVEVVLLAVSSSEGVEPEPTSSSPPFLDAVDLEGRRRNKREGRYFDGESGVAVGGDELGCLSFSPLRNDKGAMNADFSECESNLTLAEVRLGLMPLGEATNAVGRLTLGCN